MLLCALEIEELEDGEWKEFTTTLSETSFKNKGVK